VNNLLTASPSAIASVLVIDRELGFMFALSQALRKRNIAAIPCCSVGEAEALLANLQPDLSVLLINCSCPGVCAFVRELRRRSKLRVVGITSDSRQCRQCEEGLDATIRDPEDRRPEKIERCAEIVQALVRGVRQVYQQ
jgi:DNA-binding response OmpR family regulator